MHCTGIKAASECKRLFHRTGKPRLKLILARQKNRHALVVDRARQGIRLGRHERVGIDLWPLMLAIRREPIPRRRALAVRLTVARCRHDAPSRLK